MTSSLFRNTPGHLLPTPAHRWNDAQGLHSVQHRYPLSSPPAHPRDTPDRGSRHICHRRECLGDHYPEPPRIKALPQHARARTICTPTLGCTLRGKATLGSICKRHVRGQVRGGLGYPIQPGVAAQPPVSFTPEHRSEDKRSSFGAGRHTGFESRVCHFLAMRDPWQVI